MPQRTLFKINLSYFLFFSVLGCFLPYFALYCRSIGFSGREIGLLFAILPFVKSFGPIIWGIVADRTGARKKIFIIAALASVAFFTGFLLTTSFTAMAFLIAFYGSSRSALIPMIEATTWEYIGTQGGEYGKIRVWGSFGFIMSAFICGNLAHYFGIRSLLYVILILSWALAALAFKVPEQKKLSQPFHKSDFIAFLKRPEILVFLLICILMRVSHGAFNGFFSIHLSDLGYSYRLIAVMWPIGVGAEVLLMWNYQKLFKNVSPTRVMALSTFAAALRWILIATVAHPFWMALSQMLHALTFAGFHIAAITYVNAHFPKTARTASQGLYSALSFGVGGSIGLVLSGVLFDHVGSASLFLIFSVFALLASMVALTQTLRKKEAPQPAS
jgi:MFS transporter, PPP family, 3-phenylpropionic acid transporter